EESLSAFALNEYDARRVNMGRPAISLRREGDQKAYIARVVQSRFDRGGKSRNPLVADIIGPNVGAFGKRRLQLFRLDRGKGSRLRAMERGFMCLMFTSSDLEARGFPGRRLADRPVEIIAVKSAWK